MKGNMMDSYENEYSRGFSDGMLFTIQTTIWCVGIVCLGMFLIFRG
jgi:hypothetical protein